MSDPTDDDFRCDDCHDEVPEKERCLECRNTPRTRLDRDTGKVLVEEATADRCVRCCRYHQRPAAQASANPDPVSECPRCGRLVRDCPRWAWARNHEAASSPSANAELDCRAHEYLNRALKAEEERDALKGDLAMIALDYDAWREHWIRRAEIDAQKARDEAGRIVATSNERADIAIAERDAAVAARVLTKQELEEREAFWTAHADNLAQARAKAELERDAALQAVVHADDFRIATERERDEYRAKADSQTCQIDALNSRIRDLRVERDALRAARDAAESACSTWAEAAAQVARASDELRGRITQLESERDEMARVAGIRKQEDFTVETIKELRGEVRECHRSINDLCTVIGPACARGETIMDAAKRLVERKDYLTVVDAIARETASPEDAARIARETRQERDRLRDHLDRVLDERNVLKQRLDDLADAAGRPPTTFSSGVVHDLMRDQARVQLLEHELSEQRRGRILAENERAKAEERVAAGKVTHSGSTILLLEQLETILAEAAEPGEMVAQTAWRLVRMAVSSEEMCRAMERRGADPAGLPAILAEASAPGEPVTETARRLVRYVSCVTCEEPIPPLCESCRAGVASSAARLMVHAAPIDDVATRRLPPSLPSTGPVIAGLVAADLFARAAEGERQYGQPLRPFNGRAAGIDRYQEDLDRAMYDRQDIEEKREMLRRVREELKSRLAHVEAGYCPGSWDILEEIERWLAPYEAQQPAQAPQPTDGHLTPEWAMGCTHDMGLGGLGHEYVPCGKPALPTTELPRCAEHASKYRAPVQPASAGPVCATCNDTHRIEHPEQRGMKYLCMDCPLPCHKCVGEEALGRSYCATAPCPCLCHQPAQKADRNEDHECPECGHPASDHRPQINGKCGAALNEPCMCWRKP